MSLYGSVAGIVSASQEIEPHRLSFGAVASPGYFDPAPSGLNDFTDTFGSTGTFTRYTEGTMGTFSVAGNTGTLAHTANQNDILVETSHSFSVPNIWCEIYVPSIPTPCNTGFDNSGVGIVKDANNFLFASFDRRNTNRRIQIKIGGVNNFLSSADLTWTAPFYVGFSLVGNSASIWRKTTGDWTHLLTVDVSSHYDFTTVGNLSGWRAGFTYVNGGANGTWNFQNFKAGRFGGVGIRDFTVVTNEDGTPYFSGNLVYLTATCVDPAGIGYLGIFSLDTTTNQLVQTGVVFVEDGGKLQRYLNGHIIYYANGDRRLVIATWSGAAVLSVLHKLITSGSQPDILATNSNIVASMTALSLPAGSGTGGQYDCNMAYDSANSRWLMAYAIAGDPFPFSPANNFWAALASSPDLSTWTLIGEDTSRKGYEGTRIVRANRKYWVLAGGPQGSGNSSVIYDTSMTHIGALPGAVFSGGTDTQPWPTIFALPDKRHVMLLTFDNTKYGTANFTWGQPKIQKSPRFW